MLNLKRGSEWFRELFGNSPLVFVCLSGLSAANEGSCEVPAKGFYKNDNYGFSYNIPAGLSGYNGASCDIDGKGQCVCWGNHSLVVKIGENAMLGSYADSPVEIPNPTSKTILKAFLDGLHAYGTAGDAKLLSVDEATLDGRRGYTIRATYTQDGVQVDLRSSLFYANGARVEVMLIAPRGQLAKYNEFLHGVLASWKWTSSNLPER